MHVFKALAEALCIQYYEDPICKQTIFCTVRHWVHFAYSGGRAFVGLAATLGAQ